MLLAALTGGIGTGKSTVAAGLAARGAAVIDVDGVGREVVEPGGAAYRQVVERFGPGVVLDDGRINRPALAAQVFADEQALADLNGITHPAMARVMAARAEKLAASFDVVVLDLALLNIATPDLFNLGAVLVVDVPEDVAVARLVEHRGFAEADARARVASQVGRAERLALADYVIDNHGDPAALEMEIERAWQWLQARVKEVSGQ